MQVYDSLPLAIGVTAAVVFVVVGIAFRSVVVPLRSIFTIALTLSFVYGSATYVYEHNILNSLGFWGLHGRGALSWIPPLLNFSLLVGLSLGM